jgi:hypothetical protein
MGLSRQINAPVLPPEFEGLHIATGQLRGGRIGTGLGFS